MPELATNIVSHVQYGGNLLALARVNHFLSNIALDRIWGYLDNYVPIVLIFPKASPAEKDKENSEVCIYC